MSRSRRTGKIRTLRPPKLTISCPQCEVTWRGKPGDSCWHCGSRDTDEAAPLRIKIIS